MTFSEPTNRSVRLHDEDLAEDLGEVFGEVRHEDDDRRRGHRPGAWWRSTARQSRHRRQPCELAFLVAEMLAGRPSRETLR
ncbi:hypothetical protein [Streptomyces sp. NPDC059883]|uniref:hypothetical protein n=1 Tax=unclassified Streptomyces TaxID=2593676 RepID=UPI0036475027